METLNDLPYCWWGWKKSGKGWVGAPLGYWRTFRVRCSYTDDVVKALGAGGCTARVWHYQRLEVMSGRITHHCVLLPGDPRWSPGVLQVWLGNWVSCDYWYRPSGSSATFLNWKGGWIVSGQHSHRWVDGSNKIGEG